MQLEAAVVLAGEVKHCLCSVNRELCKNINNRMIESKFSILAFAMLFLLSTSTAYWTTLCSLYVLI